jgi:amidase
MRTISRVPRRIERRNWRSNRGEFRDDRLGERHAQSIRLPSAYASLFGLPPSMGLFGRDGIAPIAHTRDVSGPLARTVTNLAIGLDATVGADPNNSATTAVADFHDADVDVADTVRSAARSMHALGAEVVEVAMADFDEVIAGKRMRILEMRFDLAKYSARPGGAPMKSLHEILELGLYEHEQEARCKVADTIRGPMATSIVSASESRSSDRVSSRW